MAAYLVLSDGERVEVVDGMILGRVKSCTVVVADTKASRRHARLIVQGGVVEIEDLASSNGTLLNGKPVTKRMLRDGDVVRIGKTEITYQETAAAPAPAGDFTGGDDLFGDDDPPAETASRAPAAAPPASTPTPPSPPVTPTPPSPAPPAPPATPKPFEPVVEMRQSTPAGPEVIEEVLEFADDDVVTVKRTLPTKRSAPGKQPAPAATRAGGVLQFNKIEAKGGLVGEDLAQMSLGMRALLIVVVFCAAAGLFYLVLQMVSG